MPEWIVAINSGHAPLLPREGGKVYLLNHYESRRVLGHPEKILKNAVRGCARDIQEQNKSLCRGKAPCSMPEWIIAINSGHGPLLPRGGGKVYLLNHHESGRVLKILKKHQKVSSRPR